MSWIRHSYLNYSLNLKNIHSSAANPEKIVSKSPEPEVTNSTDLNSVPLRRIDKRILVWSGKFKRIEDVPDRISRAVLAKAQSLCRIKTCNYMTLAVIIGAAIYIMLGKRDAKKGLTITKMNEDWHRKYNENYMEREKNAKK